MEGAWGSASPPASPSVVFTSIPASISCDHVSETCWVSRHQDQWAGPFKWGQGMAQGEAGFALSTRTSSGTPHSDSQSSQCDGGVQVPSAR
jgi:hypothetical protein